jgi:molybdopterin/thiamine biosynthesis adenylyltransferase
MTTDTAQLQEVFLPRRAARSAAAPPLPLGLPLIGCAPGALEILRKLTIAVIGCGSVGGRIAVLLARMGLGGLVLVDPKNYRAPSVQRAGSIATQDILPADIGRPKALVVARRCKAISPATRVQALVGPVAALELAALAEADLVLMAPDLLVVEVDLAQRCLWLAKPLVQGSVHGPSLTAHIRLFLNAKGGAGGCPACCYGRDEWELLARQARFSCEGAPGAAAASAAAGPATNSLSALCSLAADLAVLQIVRFLLQLGQPVADTMLEYNGFTHRTVISPIVRNPKCRLAHTPFTQVTVDAPLADLPLSELTQRATGRAIAPDAQFEVAGADWVEFAACGCAQPTSVRQFVPRGSGALSCCPTCSAPLQPLSFYTHRSVSASVLGSAVEPPLRKLGARHVASVVLRTGDSGFLIRPRLSTPHDP